MDWQTYASNLAQRLGLPTEYLHAIIQGESSGNPSAFNTNPAHYNRAGRYVSESHDYGLLQLNDHGQGAGQAVGTLYDATANLDIGVPPIAAAYRAAKASGASGLDLFMQTVHGSGHTIAAPKVAQLYQQYVAPNVTSAPSTQSGTPLPVVGTATSAGADATPSSAPPTAVASPSGRPLPGVLEWLTNPAQAMVDTEQGAVSGTLAGPATRWGFGIVGGFLVLAGLITLALPRAASTIVQVVKDNPEVAA